ncbi:MAG: DUF4202 domain-containing protein [Deltaproteobacteria bacterium]|nr:DUF4202 domain-containing protein [Deltaproteobacteria bacterium]
MVDEKRYKAALEKFDAANREDPNKEIFQGKEWPKEWLYAQRMSGWLERLEPNASEPLRLAARCQHICRWKIPRGQFPMDRKGYHQWRTTLFGLHAKKAGEILREVGYDEKTTQRVQDLLWKKGLKGDPEVQLLEDAICLVFLEYYFADFSKKHNEEKVIEILQKTWKKMTPRGHQVALQLKLPAEALALIQKALSRT